MDQNDPSVGRLAELDSLRGCAALVVVLNHFALVFGPRTPALGPRIIPGLFKTFELSPLHIFIAGHEAVMLFFLLSGFVMSLPYWHQSNAPYCRYLIKRFFRLYVPYLAALVLACIANYYISGTMPAASDWFNYVWKTPPDRHSVLQHVIMIGNYGFSRYNTAFWSLVYEARVSLVFPLIMFLMSRVGWRVSLFSAVALSVSAQCVALKFQDQNTIATMHYAALFIIGALGARHRAKLSGWMAKIGHKKRRAMMLAAFFVLSTNQLLKHAPGVLHKVPFLTDWPAIIASSVLLLSALECPAIGHFLLLAIPRYLGKISYSVYLIHATILFAMVHLLLGKISAAFLFLAYLSATIAVSSLFHYGVEAPAIALGRRFRKTRGQLTRPTRGVVDCNTPRAVHEITLYVQLGNLPDALRNTE